MFQVFSCIILFVRDWVLLQTPIWFDFSFGFSFTCDSALVIVNGVYFSSSDYLFRKPKALYSHCPIHPYSHIDGRLHLYRCPDGIRGPAARFERQAWCVGLAAAQFGHLAAILAQQWGVSRDQTFELWQIKVSHHPIRDSGLARNVMTPSVGEVQNQHGEDADRSTPELCNIFSFSKTIIKPLYTFIFYCFLKLMLDSNLSNWVTETWNYRSKVI